MADTTEFFELVGPGPFELPLLASVSEIMYAADKSFAVIVGTGEGGQTVYLPISNQAVPALAELLATLPAVHGNVLPPGSPTSGERH